MDFVLLLTFQLRVVCHCKQNVQYERTDMYYVAGKYDLAEEGSCDYDNSLVFQVLICSCYSYDVCRTTAYLRH